MCHAGGSMNYSDITLEQMISLAAQAGAQAGIMAYKEELKISVKENNNRKLRNTRLLLGKYRLFKEHIDNATYKKSQIEEASAVNWFNEMYDPSNKADQIVSSIMNSAVKTRIMVQHISKMVDIYKVICERNGAAKMLRRYSAFYGRYISPKRIKYETVAEEWGVDVRTVQNDLKEAVQDFSSLLFGVDWLSKDNL